MIHLPQRFQQMRRLDHLVENKTSFTLEHAEMHVFETHQDAERVLLCFDQPVLASMLRGKKVMHLREHQPFDFLPGESIIMPAHEPMCIDFPEASLHNPTKCLAMTVSQARIEQMIALLNETLPKADADAEWRFTDYNFRFANDAAIQQIIQRLLFLFMEDHPSKDLFADFMLRELIVRILQSESRKTYRQHSADLSGERRLAHVIEYIRAHLSEPISIEALSQQAYMSESHFHRVFKNELGMSPIDFINEERIELAVRLLRDPRRKIKDVYMACGFNSLSYFTRLFKRKTKLSPKHYQEQWQQGQL